MIKNRRSQIATLMFLGLCLILLSSCTQTIVGTSPDLSQQLASLQQQQTQQAKQLSELQLQLAQLQQQLLVSTPVPPITMERPQQQRPEEIEPATIPAAISQEVAALADSASTYLSAFSNLAAGRYSVAEGGFDIFLSEYPNHQYAPNARYWLASSQLSQGKLQLASSNLRQIIIDMEGQQRAPAALFMLAKIYSQQQMLTEADEVLDQLRDRYPDSQEAQQLYKEDELQL